jgi:hypothetical protein
VLGFRDIHGEDAMDINNFQRVGSVSNAHAGNDFESLVCQFFARQGIALTRNFAAPVGVGEQKKLHRFDLGSEKPPVLVECKSHTWTQGGNMPSAKMTVWNETMYYFHLAPATYRKILFVLEHSRRELHTRLILSPHTRAHDAGRRRDLGIRRRDKYPEQLR